MNGGEKLANYQPTDFRFSPDDRRLTYLHAASHQIARQLWGVDLGGAGAASSSSSALTPYQVASAPQGQGDTEATLSRDEKLRRERQRAYAVGVTAYAWAGPRRVLVPMQGSLYVQEEVGSGEGEEEPRPLRLVYDAKAPRRGGAAPSPSSDDDDDDEAEFHDATATAVDGSEEEEEEEEEDGQVTPHRHHQSGKEEEEEEELAGGAIDPHASPDGQWVAFVRRGEVYVVPLEEGLRGMLAQQPPPPSSAASASSSQEEEEEERALEGGALRLTFGADEAQGRTHGLAEFIAQEEMDRFSGFWWAPDSKGLAFCAVDEGMVPPYAITHQGLDTTGEECVEVHRYPFAGGRNARVSLWAVRFEEGEGEGGGLSLAERWAMACRGEEPPRLVPTPIDLHPSSSTDDNNDNAPSPMEEEEEEEAGAAAGGGPRGSRRRRRRRDSSGADAAVAVGGKGKGKKRGKKEEKEGQGKGGEEEEVYLARVHWLPDGCLGVQVQDRRQSVLRLLRCCPRTGRSHLLLEERAPEGLWVNLHHLFKPLRSPILPPPSSSSSAAAAAEQQQQQQQRRSSPRRRKRGQQQQQQQQGQGGGGEEEEDGPSAMVLSSSSDINNTASSSSNGGGGTATGAFSFLWGTEARGGFMHLDLYTFVPQPASSKDPPTSVLFQQQPLARRLRAVSGGPWVVESIAGVDEERNLVFVTGTYDSPLERHLYALPLHLPPSSSNDPPNPVRLTHEAGMHAVKMDHAARRVATVFSAPDTPAKTRLFALAFTPSFQEGAMVHEAAALREVAVLHDALDRRLAAVRAKVATPEIFSLRPRDDPHTALYAALYRPDPAVHGAGPYPTVVSVYGGPHVQKVQRSWALTVDMMAQRLRDLGILVVKCDNRGSARRGLQFEAPLRFALGTVEVRDQEDVVQLLISQGLTAPGQVGVYGWSYGGFLACMCLCKAPATFRVGIAGAPVTSWDGYDTHYTERYLGLPQEHPDAYAQGSVLRHADRLSGRLLLIHGQVDENVHFRHTARLVNALIAARRPHDLLLFPDGRHSLRKAEDRLYLEQRITDFLAQTLLRGKLQHLLASGASASAASGAATGGRPASPANSSTASTSSAAAKRPLPRVPSPPHPHVNAHL